MKAAKPRIRAGPPPSRERPFQRTTGRGAARCRIYFEADNARYRLLLLASPGIRLAAKPRLDARVPINGATPKNFAHTGEASCAQVSAFQKSTGRLKLAHNQLKDGRRLIHNLHYRSTATLRNMLVFCRHGASRAHVICSLKMGEIASNNEVSRPIFHSFY